MCVCVCVFVCFCVHMEARGQLLRIGFLLLTCGPRDWTQVVRLDRKHFYAFILLAQDWLCLFIFIFFAELLCIQMTSDSFGEYRLIWIPLLLSTSKISALARKRDTSALYGDLLIPQFCLQHQIVLALETMSVFNVKPIIAEYWLELILGYYSP